MFIRLMKCIYFRGRIRLQPVPNLANTKTIYRHNMYCGKPLMMLRTFNSFASQSMSSVEHSTLPKSPNRPFNNVSKEFLARWIQLFQDKEELQTVKNAKRILFACGTAAATLEKHKRQQLAEVVFDLAPKTEEELYHIYLRSCLENHHVFDPVRILEDMESNSLQPNVTTMGLIFEQHCALGETEHALQLYKETKDLPVGLLAHLAWAYALNGLTEKSQEIIHNIKTRNVRLTWPLCSIACRSLVKIGDTQQGMDMFRDQMLNMDEKVPIPYLTLFLEELAMQGKISEAKDLVSNYPFKVNDVVHLSYYLKKVTGGMDILFYVYVNLEKTSLPKRHLCAMFEHLITVHDNKDNLCSDIEKLNRFHPSCMALCIEIALALDSPHAVSLLQDYRSNEENFSLQMLLPFIIKGQAKQVVQTNDLHQLLDFIYDFLGAEKDQLGRWLVYLFLFKHDVLHAFDWGSKFDPATISPHQIILQKSFEHSLLGSYAQQNYREIFKTTQAIRPYKVYNALMSTWLKTGDLDSALHLIAENNSTWLSESNATNLVDKCIGQGIKFPKGLSGHLPNNLSKLALLLNVDELDVDNIIETSAQLLQNGRLPVNIYKKFLSHLSPQKYSKLLASGIELSANADHSLFFGVLQHALEKSKTSEIVNLIMATCFSKDGMKNGASLMLEDFYHFCRQNNQFELIKQIHSLVNNEHLQTLYNAIMCIEGVINGRWLFAKSNSSQFHQQILKTCQWTVGNQELVDKLLKLSLEQENTYKFEVVLGHLIGQGYDIKEIRKVLRKHVNYEALSRLLPLTYRAAVNYRGIVSADTTLRQLYRYQDNLNIRINFYFYRQMLYLMHKTSRENQLALLEYAEKWFDKYKGKNFPETIELRDILTEAVSTNDFSKVRQKQSHYNPSKKFNQPPSGKPSLASTQD